MRVKNDNSIKLMEHSQCNEMTITPVSSNSSKLIALFERPVPEQSSHAEFVEFERSKSCRFIHALNFIHRHGRCRTTETHRGE